MAEVNIDIAKQSTSDEINSKLGLTDDTNGSSTEGTMQAELNACLLKTDGISVDMNDLNARLDGQSTPYGTGVYGDVNTYGSIKFPSLDSFNRYVLNTKSFKLAGGIFKPPTSCDGLYILSQGNVTINGTIDMRDCRKTFGVTQMAKTINIGDNEYTLACGGYAPLGGASGSGGTVLGISGYQDYHGDGTPAPSIIPINSIAGNINGGGIGQYGKGGSSSLLYTNYNRDYDNWDGDDYNAKYGTPSEYVAPQPQLLHNEHAPGALVIIAAGTVTINGKILSTGYSGSNATDGGTSKITYSNGWGSSWYYTMAGVGAIPPSGGGPVTIICKKLIMNGLIDTSGVKFISPDGINHSDKTVHELGDTSSTFAAYHITGSNGGKGGTFISTAGEIRVYETGGEA